ncbi:unnamed protein product [Phytomonas sp. EM1]|nr:unnamed protein product [Phytomonas sp. EM1]|eukprot:CCW60398.1 unnamed protein product [Phytomonas sp. isolate EM1]
MTKLSAGQVGKLVCDSFGELLSKNLDIKPIVRAHEIVSASMKTVDPSMALYVFGSTAVYGFHESGCDVDFVALSSQDVVDGKGADPSSELAKNLQVDFLSRLQTSLREMHNLTWQVDLVRRTRVPVLRVKGGPCGIDFDVTARRRNGVRNSALLRAYFAQQPATRWLSMAIKQWSKRAGFNMSVDGGCLTSYGCNLMVVFYLLQRRLVEFVEPERCDVAHIAPLPSYLPLELPTQNGCELGDMVLDFLNFYLHEFNADTEVITLSRTEKTTKEMLHWTKQAEDMARICGEKVNYRWCIEDPFEHNLNVGRYVTPFKLTLLRKHMERAKETALLLNTTEPAFREPL